MTELTRNLVNGLAIIKKGLDKRSNKESVWVIHTYFDWYPCMFHSKKDAENIFSEYSFHLLAYSANLWSAVNRYMTVSWTMCKR